MRDRWVRTFIVARVVLAALVSATVNPTSVLAQTTGGARTTLPSPESLRSLLMSNWTDFLAIHQARQLYPKDTHLFGPYLAALHSGVDWTTPQIDGATAFFHAEVLGGANSGNGQGSLTGPEQPPTLCESSGNVTGDNAPANPGLRQSYPSIMCFDDGGVMNVEYLRETERGLPIQIQKSYAMVPNQHFLVVRYTLTNNIPRQYNKQVLVRFAEVAQLHNKQAQHYQKAADTLVDTGLYQPPNGQPLDDLQAQWHPELNAWIADMSVANGTYLVFGAFQDMDRHRVFDPGSEQVEFDRAMAPEMDNVDQPGPPESVEQLTAKDLGLSAWKQVVIDPGAQQQYSFFYAVAATVDEAQQIARQARSSTVDNWFNQTRQAYQAWLQKGKQVQIPDAGLRNAYTRGLITTKQSQQPEFGSFVAATNPAYGYKVWPRDSSVTALGLVASGHLDEAVKFFQWMASVQEDGTKSGYPTGTRFSNYSFWLHKGPKYFREPEWDSLGLFMIGVYRTWQALQQQNPQAADDFLTGPIVRFDQGPTSVYEAVRRTAQYLKNNINDKGYAPGDYSIWEEDFEWATFTQTASASGLNAAHLLAAAMGEPDLANDWLNSARHILNTIHRAASAQPCPGLWNDKQVRWNRATWINCTRDDRLDAASSLVWVFGLVLANDQRADQQRNAVLARLNPRHDGVGIARYEGDEFYHAKPYSPGGAFESSVSMPAWPQLDMYLALLEHWRGLDDVVLRRLQFYASVTARYLPGDTAVIDVQALSPTSTPVTGPIELTIFHLQDQLDHTTSSPVTLQPNTPTSVELRWKTPMTDFTGYMAVVSAGGRVIGSTGIDVSSSSLGYPRYGYLSKFSPDQTPAVTGPIVQRLALDYHLNLFEFYDWFWRHEKLIQRTNGTINPTWTDLFGRTNTVSVIHNLVDSVHQYNALAMPYVMIYAAREGYAQLWPISPSWGLFSQPKATGQLSFDFSAQIPGEMLYLFDPGNPKWQAWMGSEYVDAVNAFGFDGAHIDQLGQRQGVLRADGTPVDLPSAFVSFLEATDARLSTNDPKKAACTFNLVDGTVNGWAVPEVAGSSACDFLYSEIWYKSNSYDDLRRYVEQLRSIGRHRPVVLAAYAQYGEDTGPVYEAEGQTTLAGGAGIANNVPGFTGLGFVDGMDRPGDSITWTITLPESATEPLVFRYSNASGHTLNAQVSINGTPAGSLQLPSAAEWSAWVSSPNIQVQLAAGANKITLAVAQDTGAAMFVDNLRFSEFSEAAVHLQMAAIFASGATSIFIGDDQQGLGNPYYPDRSKALPPQLKRALRDDMSFISAYETLLFPPEVVSLGNGTGLVVALTGQRLLDKGGNGIWVVPRQIGPYDILHLVNLVTLDDQWRSSKQAPPLQTNIRLRYYASDRIDGVYLASPDVNYGRTSSLPFTTGQDPRGAYVEFTVPQLAFWDMIYVRRHV